MGDLHSIAYSTPGYCTSSSLGWEFQNLGVFNTDMSPLVMGNSTPPYFSSFDSDCSTGYLEDALFEFSSKRRRLMLFSDDQANYSTSAIQSCWKENVNENEIYPENSCYMKQINNMDNTVAGHVLNSKNIREVTTFEEETRPVSEGTINTDSSTSSPIYKDSLNIKSISENLDSLVSGGGDMKERKKVMTRVVYPFAVVKPGGSEGEVTLNDINERISMTPTRAVRHPVGDFACRPIVSPNGPGLSGKAVVALTRIQTQGRGTITIIRTRG